MNLVMCLAYVMFKYVNFNTSIFLFFSGYLLLEFRFCPQEGNCVIYSFHEYYDRVSVKQFSKLCYNLLLCNGMTSTNIFIRTEKEFVFFMSHLSSDKRVLRSSCIKATETPKYKDRMFCS